MNKPLSYEAQGTPQSHPYYIPRTPEGYEHPQHSRVNSISSRSTVSATVRGHNASIVATGEKIDLMVRQSVASRGQPISVAMIDPVQVPPVPPLPEHLEPLGPESGYTIPPIFEPPPLESSFTEDRAGIPLAESPISYAPPLPFLPPPFPPWLVRFPAPPSDQFLIVSVAPTQNTPTILSCQSRVDPLIP